MVAFTRDMTAELAETPEPVSDLEELEHSVREVFRMKEKIHPILLACEHHGIESMEDLICLRYVDPLTYISKEGFVTDPQSGHIGLLHSFKNFAEAFARRALRRDAGLINWMEITHKDYVQYMTTSLQEFEKGIRLVNDPRKSATNAAANVAAINGATNSRTSYPIAAMPSKLACKTSSSRIAARFEPTANVSRSATITANKTVINTVAHNICVEDTGGEIEPPKCNSGETSNTHTTIGNPKFNYVENHGKQTPHSSARNTVPMIDCNINLNLSLTTVNTCEVKYSSDDSMYSHIAMISNDDDTFNKDIEGIDPTKVNVATTKLADDDPIQCTAVLEIDGDSTYETVTNSTGVKLATNKIADDDPLQATSKLENNDLICAIVVSANPVKVNVVINILADDDPVVMTSELANATVDSDPVKVNIKINKLADNDPVHQTGTLEKVQFNATNGKRTLVTLSTVDKVTKATNPAKDNVATTKLADDDPAHQNGILERKQDCNNLNCDDALIDILIAPSVNLKGVEMATNNIVDDDPHASTSERENNDPVCVFVVSDTVKVNVATNALAENDPVKDNKNINKLADNVPVHQTDTLKETQFNALDGKIIFQIPKSTNGEPSATSVKNADVNSVSLQRILVLPSTIDLTDDDPAFIIDSCCQCTKQNICFQERGVVHLVPSDYNNNDSRLSLATALIDTLADDDPYNNSHIVTPSMLLQGNTLDMMSEEMGSVGTNNGAG